MDKNIDKQGQDKMKKDRLEQDLRNVYLELSDIEEKSNGRIKRWKFRKAQRKEYV